MFSSNTYQNRRKNLFNSIEDGLILFPGNNPVPMNYPSNHLPFRQDSNFMYYCGLDFSHLSLVLDVDEGEAILFGDDLSVDEIVWEGERTPISQMAESSGIDRFLSSKNKGAIGLINSILKYPDLFSLLDLQLSKILFPI